MFEGIPNTYSVAKVDQKELRKKIKAHSLKHQNERIAEGMLRLDLD
jgi:hypothetical protein